MKFQINSTDFQKALSIVDKAIAVRSSLPVLENIYLQLTDTTLTLRGNDLELGIEYAIPIETVMTPGEILIKSKTLLNIVSKLNNQSLTISVENNKVKITGTNVDFTIHGEPVTEYPSFPAIENGQTIDFSVSELRSLIQHTIFAVSFDETKKFLNGIFLDQQETQLSFVATDGYRLAQNKFSSSNSPTPFGVIAPFKAVSELSKILQSVGEDDVIQMNITSAQIAFKLNTLSLVSRVIQGSFPDYNQVIPTNSQHLFNVSRTDLLAATERASLIASSSNNVVKLIFENNQLTVMASSAGLGDFKESLILKPGSHTQSARIALNVRLMMDVIKIIDTPEVSFLFNNELSPCQLIPKDSINFNYIIMPIRTSEFNTTSEMATVESTPA